MSIAWGDFEDMAVHYLRELAKREDETPLLFRKTTGSVYGVCKAVEYKGLCEVDSPLAYRLVCMTIPDEFMGLLLARFLDFTTEEENDVKKKDISTGELFGGESAAVDAGGDKG